MRSWVAGVRGRDRAELWQKGNNCILGFKGSDLGLNWDTLHDWQNNLDFWKESFKGLRDVHGGFVDELRPLFLQIETFEPKLSANCPGTFVVTGHSLGGAIASIFAAVVNTDSYECNDYKKKSECKKDVSCDWSCSSISSTLHDWQNHVCCHLVQCAGIDYEDCISGGKFEGCYWNFGEDATYSDIQAGSVGHCEGTAGEIECQDVFADCFVSAGFLEYSRQIFLHTCRWK